MVSLPFCDKMSTSISFLGGEDKGCQEPKKKTCGMKKVDVGSKTSASRPMVRMERMKVTSER